MLEAAKAKWQKTIGITDEDWEKHISYPHNRLLLEHMEEMEKYQVIAEVTESKYCNAGIKPGTKLVFNLAPALMLAPETDCPLCVRAIYPVHDVVSQVQKRFLEGQEPNISELRADCLDPGLEKGGIGHVVFKVYARKVTG